MTISHLRRLCRSVPLLRFPQGSTISVRSNLLKPVQVTFRTQWRDDGLVEWEQTFSQHQPRDFRDVQMVVSQLQDISTSMGRTLPHISIELREDDAPGEDRPSQHCMDMKQAIRSNPSKPTDRVILDDGTILPDSEEWIVEGIRRVEYHDGIAHVGSNEDSNIEQSDKAHLTVTIPEKVNIVCRLDGGGGHITVKNKVEGDVNLSTVRGDLYLQKVRGHAISLQADGPDSVIHASELLEAQNLSVHAGGRFRAKQIHGTQVDIQIPPQATTQGETQQSHDIPDRRDDDDDEGSLIDVGALFVSGHGGATLGVGFQRPVRRAVRVKSSHGPVRVETKNVTVPRQRCEHTEELFPLVELGGVNGNCEVSIEMEAPTNLDLEYDWISCQVHFDSLSPDTVSVLTAEFGDVAMTLDRKMEADLRLLSTSSPVPLTEWVELLADEEDSSAIVEELEQRFPGASTNADSHSQISIHTQAFSPSPHQFTSKNLEYKEGTIQNKSQEPDSRFEQKVRGVESVSVGKIRLDGAAEQALKAFGNEDKDNESSVPYQKALLVVTGRAGIEIETVSWLGAIARRYGMQETGKELGRTATRRGRPIAPQTE